MVLEEASATGLEETLETNLEEILQTNLEKVTDTNSEHTNVTPHYDVILQVKPEKVSPIIDGQKRIVIPINDNEETTVNGIDNLI